MATKQELNAQFSSAKYLLRQTYNILSGFDADKETPMDEVELFIRTAASKARKVELAYYGLVS